MEEIVLTNRLTSVIYYIDITDLPKIERKMMNETMLTIETKPCITCKIDKPISAFGMNGQYTRNECIECRKNNRRQRYLVKKEAQPPKVIINKTPEILTSRICMDCNINLPIENFSKNGEFYKTKCKECVNKYSRERHEQIKDIRNIQVREKYWQYRDVNPTIEDIQKEIQQENGVKNCSQCKLEKKYEEFYIQENGRISSKCKECAKEYRKMNYNNTNQ